MRDERSKKQDKVKNINKEQSRGRWMAPGSGIGATLGILFGNFILGPAMGSQTTGFVLGMSMGPMSLACQWGRSWSGFRFIVKFKAEPWNCR